MTAPAAYINAGYKSDKQTVVDAASSRLFKNVKIKARLREFTEAAAMRVVVTRASLIQECEEIRALAVKDGQYSAAIAAVKEKGVLSGERVERTEFGRPGEFADMSDKELRQALIEENKRLKLLPAPKAE